MLTFEENGWNLKYIKISSILNLLPFQIDGKTGRIQRQKSPLRRFIWKCFYFAGCFDSLFIFGRLIHVILEPEKYFRWDHFVVHLVILMGYFSCLLVTPVLLYFQNCAGCVIIFNHVFSQKEKRHQTGRRHGDAQDQNAEVQGANVKENGMEIEVESRQEENHGPKNSDKTLVRKSTDAAARSSKSPTSSEIRPLFSWPPKYSLHELLGRTLPIIGTGTVLFILLVLVVDLTRIHFLYSVLPKNYQNVYTFAAGFGLEILVVGDAICFAVFCILIQLEFLDKCEFTFAELERRLRNLLDNANDVIFSRDGELDSRGSDLSLRLGQILKEMKEQQLSVELFNRCFPFCIFNVKLIFLFFSVFGGFVSIRHYRDYPFIVCLTGYLGFMCTIVYAVVYQKAFIVPQKMATLKNLTLLVAVKVKNSKVPLRFVSYSGSGSDLNPNFMGLRNAVWSEVKRDVRRIREVGIQVGSFHQMERTSTPNYVDFAVKQIVNLLVLFPRH